MTGEESIYLQKRESYIEKNVSVLSRSKSHKITRKTHALEHFPASFIILAFRPCSASTYPKSHHIQPTELKERKSRPDYYGVNKKQGD